MVVYLVDVWGMSIGYEYCVFKAFLLFVFAPYLVTSELILSITTFFEPPLTTDIVVLQWKSDT